MASKYASRLQVPDGFNNLLRDFVREVLRSQPSNIYQFGANYFKDRVVERAKPVQVTAERKLSKGDVELILKDAFSRADTDFNGYLHHARFAAVLRDEVRLQLNERQILHVMSYAAENDYGMIEYKRNNFLTVAADVIVKLLERPTLPDNLATAPLDVLLVRNLMRVDCERMLMDAFLTSDLHSTGVLNRPELCRALSACALGLTSREVNMLMTAADDDKEGMVDYRAFATKCFAILRHELVAEMASVRYTPKDWATRLLDALRNFDSEDTGALHCIDLRNVLMTSDLGLSHLQVYELLADAEEDENGFVSYAPIVDKASTKISDMWNIDDAVRHSKYVQQFVGVDIGEFDIRGALKISFDVSEPLSRTRIRDILRADTALRLSASEINALMATVEEDERGFGATDTLISIGYDVLKFLSFQRALRARVWDKPPFRILAPINAPREMDA